MSNKPNPVALTAAMLALRVERAAPVHADPHGVRTLDAARLASDLHRLSPACKRQAEAKCNGEFWDGQRDYARQTFYGAGRIKQHEADLDAEIEKRGQRLDRRISRLNESLSAYGVEAFRTGDPRGYTLRLRALPGHPALPSNELGGDYGIG